MGIKLKKADISAVKRDASARRPAKPRYKNSHLPFKNPTRDLLTWRDAVLPPIIDWAGSLEEPFAINSHPDLPDIVEDCWKEEFPEIPVDEAVQAVVSHSDAFAELLAVILTHIDRDITLRQVQQYATGEVPLGSMLSCGSQKSLPLNHSRTQKINGRNMLRTN
jgi:hypothetical protein